MRTADPWEIFVALMSKMRTSVRPMAEGMVNGLLRRERQFPCEQPLFHVWGDFVLVLQVVSWVDVVRSQNCNHREKPARQALRRFENAGFAVQLR